MTASGAVMRTAMERDCGAKGEPDKTLAIAVGEGGGIDNGDTAGSERRSGEGFGTGEDCSVLRAGV